LPPVGLTDMGWGLVGWLGVRHSAGKEGTPNPQIPIPLSPIFTATSLFPSARQWRRMGTVGKGKNYQFE
jgi:hypothetical protein